MEKQNEQMKNKMQVIKAKLRSIRKQAKYVKLCDDKVFEQAFLVLCSLFFVVCGAVNLYGSATRYGGDFDISNFSFGSLGFSTSMFGFACIATLTASMMKDDMKKNVQSRIAQIKQKTKNAQFRAVRLNQKKKNIQAHIALKQNQGR